MTWLPRSRLSESLWPIEMPNRPLSSRRLSSKTPWRTRQHRNRPSVPLRRATQFRTTGRCEPLPGWSPRSVLSSLTQSIDRHVVRLLEADPVAVVVPHDAAPDRRAEAAIEVDPRAAAAVEGGIGVLVPLDDEVLDARPLDVRAADDGEDGGRLRVAGDHAVGHQRRVDREGVAAAPRDPGHGGMEAPGVVVPDRDAAAHGEARGVLDRDLLLAEVAVEGQRRDGRVGLAQDRLALPAADRDVRAQVERVAHQVLALADLDDPAAQARDVIDGRLECPVVGPDQVGPGPAHRDRGPLAHLRVHGVRKLPLVGLRGEVVGAVPFLR